MIEEIKVNEIPKEYYKKRLDELKDEVNLLRSKYETLTSQLMNEIREYKLEIEQKNDLINTFDIYDKKIHCFKFIVYKPANQNQAEDYKSFEYSNFSKMDILNAIQGYCYETNTSLDLFEVMNILDSAYSSGLTKEIKIGEIKLEITREGEIYNE